MFYIIHDCKILLLESRYRIIILKLLLYVPDSQVNMQKNYVTHSTSVGQIRTYLTLKYKDSKLWQHHWHKTSRSQQLFCYGHLHQVYVCTCQSCTCIWAYICSSNLSSSFYSSHLSGIILSPCFPLPCTKFLFQLLML